MTRFAGRRLAVLSAEVPSAPRRGRRASRPRDRRAGVAGQVYLLGHPQAATSAACCSLPVLLVFHTANGRVRLEGSRQITGTELVDRSTFPGFDLTAVLPQHCRLGAAGKAAERPAGGKRELPMVADQDELSLDSFGRGEQPRRLRVPSIPASSTTTTAPGRAAGLACALETPRSRATVTAGIPAVSDRATAVRAATAAPHTGVPPACQASRAAAKACSCRRPPYPPRHRPLRRNESCGAPSRPARRTGRSERSLHGD